ncbi:MAG TPA: DUF2892 domain-containing protein [Gemmatimonadales bacterium]|nr:DUF2892 domain-containing protein [Gemmatimonadales bacterium]
MVRNVTTPERVFRLIVGVALLGLFGALPSPWKYLTLIGLIPLGTALTGSCPIYSAIGWNQSASPKGDRS